MALTKHLVREMLSAPGTFTANSTTTVVVTPAVAIGPNTQILITLKTAAGTPAAMPYLSAITAGQVGTATFSVKAGSGDTSVYNYTIIG